MSSAEKSSAVGLAMPLPAMSGALPCTASKTPISSPRLAPGTTPRPPTRPAHRSETMSPYRLGSSRMSNCVGLSTSCMQALSTIRSSQVMPGNCSPSLLKGKPCNAGRGFLSDDLQALDDARNHLVLEPCVEVLGILTNDDDVDA